MSDIKAAVKDAAAIMAALRKGDTDMAVLMLDSYKDASAHSELCSAFAAMVGICLNVFDEMRDKAQSGNQVTLISGDDVLKSVLAKLNDSESDQPADRPASPAG